MKKIVPALFMAFTLLTANAQTTTYDSVDVPFPNAGDHSWVTFYFGHLPDGEPGSTALVIQCAYDRAELIINDDVYGQQMGSQFFAVTCTHTSTNGTTSTYTLNGTPLAESLVMYGSNGAKANLNLTINFAQWKISGYGRSVQSNGSAEIVY